MKHLLFTSLFLVILVALSAGSTYAQSSVSASGIFSAEVITPTSIQEVAQMTFGNVAKTAEGKVVLTPAGTLEQTGGINLPYETDTFAAAEFDLQVEGEYTYAITLPTICRIDYSTYHMDVTDFVSDRTEADDGILSYGSQLLKIGATLNVNADQAYGLYTNETGFDVIINYN